MCKYCFCSIHNCEFELNFCPGYFGIEKLTGHNVNLHISYIMNMCVFIVCSFHVGSGAQSSTAYANALSLAKDVFVHAVSSVS